MNSEFEIITHKKLKHINIFLNRITYRSMHMHTDFELICILDGAGCINTKSQKISAKTGDIIILNSGEAHEIEAYDNAFVVIIIQISKHFLREYCSNIRNIVFTENAVCSCISAPQQQFLWELIRKTALSYIQETDFFELTCISSMADIFALLLRYVPNKIITEKEYIQRKKQSERISRIASYIEENYQLPIRLQDIADSEHISCTHLSHLFSETFGTNFQDYLSNIRFEHAVRLIGSSSASLSDIAYDSGFSELKYMTKMFEKHLGAKPKDFREQIFKSAGFNQQPKGDILEYKLSNVESLFILQQSSPRR